ncbi:hypothetical protein ACFVXC_05530 [Streptomyces sp. NPDC058257]|uniref:hypothetical protein n=1 Tax=Streptomyces sp. NPDC058257 TaxID=3346409 RepID=UPI0036E9F36A
MSTRKVKTLRRRQKAGRNQRKLNAARKFMKQCSEVLWSLPAHYDCYLTCEEVEAVADLGREFGIDEEDIEGLIEAHAEDDECGDQHHESCEYCRDLQGE